MLETIPARASGAMRVCRLAEHSLYMAPMARQRVTLRDVARHVGVHPSTVSRVLNPGTRDMITEEIAQRVTKAAEALAYQPNPIAYSLKTNRSFRG